MAPGIREGAAQLKKYFFSFNNMLKIKSKYLKIISERLFNGCNYATPLRRYSLSKTYLFCKDEITGIFK